MDETEIFNHQGRRFLCSGEQLPSGSFQAVVRCKMPPDDLVRTLVLEAGHHMTGRQALARAKELAEEWVRTHTDQNKSEVQVAPQPGVALAVAANLASLPALFRPTPAAAKRTLEFFTVHIRNPNTRKAYARSVSEFATWCYVRGLHDLQHLEPVYVATYVQQLQERMAAPSVKQHLAALRVLFDWLVVGQIIPVNPASSVRGPRHSVRKGKTPILAADEARAMLDAIDLTTPAGLRDRALIALMVYTFARVGAALQMRVEDVYVQGRRTWVRLHEKGGKEHEMPCHHNLEEYLHAYLQQEALQSDSKGLLFRSAKGRSGELSGRPMSQSDVYRMIGRRAKAAEVATKIGCHSFRATGITEYLRNGGRLEVAQQMANHESARTTGLYDRRQDQVSIDEVERILI